MILSGLSIGGSMCVLMALRRPKTYKLLILLAPGIKDWKQNMKFLKSYIMPVMAVITPTLPTIKLPPGSGNRNP